MTNNANNWFRDAAFGMFIHYGVYSLIGRGEWVANRERMPFEEYKEYAKKFKAENYNPSEWAKLAKEAGMKYMVLTTRHHDGFALFDTKTTDFNSVKLGPRKDLVKEYADAVRAEGLKVGFYFSPADWYHKDYPTPYARDWPQEWDDEEKRKRFVDFYTEQLRELMTNYGKIDLLWYDGCLPKPLDGERVNKIVKELQPDILISSRNGEPYDFAVSEQAVVAPGRDIPWESCMTLNDNWGYCPDDDNYKSAKAVILLLMDTASKGGNLLLNVGPKADGAIPEQSVEILKNVGKWMKTNGETIYGTERVNFSSGNYYKLTYKRPYLYLHLINGVDEICLALFKNKAMSVVCLATGEPAEFRQENERLFIKANCPHIGNELSRAFKIEYDEYPEEVVPREGYWIPGIDE